MFIFYSDSDKLPTGSTNDLFNIINPVAGEILSYDGSHFTNTNILSGSNIDLINIDPNNLTGTIPYNKLPNLAEITLSGDAVPPYIASITPITPNGPQEITILGEYFSPITQLNIPGVTVNNLEVRSPNKIIADISKSGLSGEKIITLANGANTNQIWAEGIKSISIFTDPYRDNVSLFIKGDGENNSTNIIDSSLSPEIIIILGNTKISTDQAKYGSSIYFDGIGDYLQVSITDGLGISDFTLEFWIYKLSDSGMIFNSRGSGGFGSDGIDINHNLVTTTLEQVLFSAVELTINVWHHIAIIRKEGKMTRFINGIPSGSANNANNFSASLFSIGGSTGGNTGFFNGYLDSIRLSNIARYTSNFNPETDTYLNI